MYDSTPEHQNFNSKEDNAQNDLIKLNDINNEETVFFKKVDKSKICIFIIFYIFIGAFTSFYYQSIEMIYVLLFLLIFGVFIFMFSDRKVTFLKDEQNNILIAKIYNHFRCRKKKLIFNFLNNAQFDIKSIKESPNRSNILLFIINNLSRSPPLNLDIGDIKIKPLNLYYILEGLDESAYTQKRTLNNFINTPNDINSPLNYNNNFSENNKNILPKIMKFSEHFYMYHARDPNEKYKKKKCSIVIFLIIFNFPLFAVGIVIGFVVLKIEKGILALLMGVGPDLILDLTVFFIFVCLNYRIKRIDCIYSPDFKKMFIGTTTINERCYKNTFEFQLSEINRFYTRSNDRKTFLSMTVNNNDIDICEIVDRLDLDEFVSILNGKINRA